MSASPSTAAREWTSRHFAFGPWADSCNAANSIVSLDDLVSARQQRLGHRNAHRLSGPEVDHQLEFRWLFDRQIGRHRAAQKAHRKSGSKVCQVIGGWAVADKATLLGPHSPLIHGWKAQCCNAFHNQRTIAVEHPGIKNIQRGGPRCLCLIDSRCNLLSSGDAID